MKITLYEEEIKDAIIRELYDKVGKLNVGREDIRLQNVGVGSFKLLAVIETAIE